MPGYRIAPPALSDEELAVFREERTEEQLEDRRRAFPLLVALQQQSHIYAGTVDPVTIAERRRRNKQARKSRRINRKRARR